MSDINENSELEIDFKKACEQMATILNNKNEGDVDHFAPKGEIALLLTNLAQKHYVQVDVSRENVRKDIENKGHEEKGHKFADPLNKNEKNRPQGMTATANNDSGAENSLLKIVVNPYLDTRGMPLDNPLRDNKDIEERQKNENANKQELKFSMPGPAPKPGMSGPKPQEYSYKPKNRLVM